MDLFSCIILLTEGGKEEIRQSSMRTIFLLNSFTEQMVSSL